MSQVNDARQGKGKPYAMIVTLSREEQATYSPREYVERVSGVLKSFGISDCEAYLVEYDLGKSKEYHPYLKTVTKNTQI